MSTHLSVFLYIFLSVFLFVSQAYAHIYFFLCFPPPSLYSQCVCVSVRVCAVTDPAGYFCFLTRCLHMVIPFFKGHTNMPTHTDSPLIHLSGCLNGDEDFLWSDSPLHLFPLNIVMSSNRETKNCGEDKRHGDWRTASPWHIENWDKGRQTARVGGLLSSVEIHRVPVAKLHNNSSTEKLFMKRALELRLFFL